MPPSKPLPPAILSALGLAATSCGILGPCLDYAVCLDYTTLTTGDTGPSTPTGGTGDTATVGPCLDFPTMTGDTSDTGSAPSTTPADLPDREELIEDYAANGTLPADVLRRLTGGPSDD